MYYLLLLDRIRVVGPRPLPERLLMAELDAGRNQTAFHEFQIPPNAGQAGGPQDLGAATAASGSLIGQALAVMAPNPSLVFLSKRQLQLFHTAKKRNKLHTHSVQNIALEEHCGAFAFVGMLPESILSSMIEHFSALDHVSPAARSVMAADDDRRRKGILACDSYSFIGDSLRRIYHRHSCPRLADVAVQNLRGLGKKPQREGYSPCLSCRPGAPQKSACAQQAAAKHPRSKAEIMKEQILSLCEGYGMHAEFFGGAVYITTIAGEWYFNYNDRPIQMRHKNAQQRYDRNGRPTGEYHRQPLVFYAPLQAITYIYRHEMAAKRLEEER